MVASQHNNVVISDIDKKTQEPKMYPCARFCCSTFDHVEELADKGTSTQTEGKRFTVMTQGNDSVNVRYLD